MRRRSPARYLAPLALIVAIVGIVVVINSGGLSPHHDPPARHARSAHRAGRFARAHFYIVAPGENLTSISHKTGIGVPALESLNPNVDPNSLQTGQRLRLRH